MKKRILSLFCALVLLLAFTPFTVTADTFDDIPDGDWEEGNYGQAGGYIYSLDADNNACIFGYEGEESGIVIPQTLNEHPVTAIAPMAFAYNERLRYVIIPEGVTAIGSGAFMECHNLGRITFPSTITAMDEGVFVNCSQLTVIRVDEACPALSVRDGVLFDKTGETLLCYPPRQIAMTYDVPEGVRAIGAAAFSGMAVLETITLPESVERIGELAFWGCASLESVTLPAALTTLAPAAFMGCQSLGTLALAEGNTALTLRDGVLFSKDGTELICYPAGRTDETYTVPDGVKTIGEFAFAGCKALKTVNLPESVKIIRKSAFADCSSLRSIPLDAVVRFYDEAFAGCSSLEEVNLCPQMTDTAIGMFRGCSSLRRIAIPEGVQVLFPEAFYDCTALEEVSLPASLENIHFNPFGGCTALKAITIAEGNADYIVRDGMLLNAGGNRLITCMAMGGVKEYAVPEGITSIQGFAFYNLPDLESLTFPSSLTFIGNIAYCPKLKTLHISAGVKEITPDFRGCLSLESITVEEGNASYYDKDGVLFYQHDYRLFGIERRLICYPAARPGTSYTIPEDTTVMESEAFDSCRYLETITFPAGLTEIPMDAFAGNSVLTTVTFAEGLTRICDRAFADCTALQQVILPASTASLSDEAFAGCTSLTAATFRGDKTCFDRTTFKNCPALTVYATEYSKADDYAWENRLPYKPLSEFVFPDDKPDGPDNPPVALGDVNGDDTVDTADAVLVLQYAAELIGDDALDTAAADVNGDGTIDTADAVLILQYAAELIESFPAAG